MCDAVYFTARNVNYSSVLNSVLQAFCPTLMVPETTFPDKQVFLVPLEDAACKISFRHAPPMQNTKVIICCIMDILSAQKSAIMRKRKWFKPRREDLFDRKDRLDELLFH